jgi:hypothetical protein
MFLQVGYGSGTSSKVVGFGGVHVFVVLDSRADQVAEELVDFGVFDFLSLLFWLGRVL